MNLESGFSPPVSVDNDEGDSLETNRSCEVQNNDHDQLLFDVNEKGAEASGSIPSEMKSEGYPSPAMARKGSGLKKWRRIKRDARKVGESGVDSGKMVMQEFPNSVGHPSKRTQVYAEREQKTEGSASSRNPVFGSLDGFTMFGDPNFVMGPSNDTETDSENTKSSTGASVPKVNFDMPVVVGFPHDKSGTRNLNGKNLGRQKGQIEAIKKAREERVKIENENSHSSMKSDSHSSNYGFMQGPNAISNGIQRGRPVHHDGENGVAVHGVEGVFNDGLHGSYGRVNGGGHQDNPCQHVDADLSQDVQKEKSTNNASSSDHGPLFESIIELQTAQEALKKSRAMYAEVLKFKEICKDFVAEDSASDTQPEVTDVGQEFQQTNFSQFPFDNGAHKRLQAVHPEMLEIGKRDIESELEDLFKRKIEAEVEYLTMSITVQNLRDAAVDRITFLEEHKNPVSEQNQLLKAEKLENCCEDIASSVEALKLRKDVCKCTSYAFVQLLSLLVILGVFILQVSPNYIEVVPT